MVEEINADALEDVLEANDVVIVDAWAPWCFPCRIMGEILEVYQERRDEYRIVKINVDENIEFGREYGIAAIPTLLIFKNRTCVGRIVGTRTMEELDKEIGKILGK